MQKIPTKNPGLRARVKERTEANEARRVRDLIRDAFACDGPMHFSDEDLALLVRWAGERDWLCLVDDTPARRTRIAAWLVLARLCNGGMKYGLPLALMLEPDPAPTDSVAGTCDPTIAPTLSAARLAPTAGAVLYELRTAGPLGLDWYGEIVPRLEKAGYSYDRHYGWLRVMNELTRVGVRVVGERGDDTSPRLVLLDHPATSTATI